jgi:hypothetical protein
LDIIQKADLILKETVLNAIAKEALTRFKQKGVKKIHFFKYYNPEQNELDDYLN